MNIQFNVCCTFEHKEPFVFMCFHKIVEMPALPPKGAEIHDGKVFFELRNIRRDSRITQDYNIMYNLEHGFYLIEVRKRYGFRESSDPNIRAVYSTFINAGWGAAGHGKGLWPILEPDA